MKQWLKFGIAICLTFILAGISFWWATNLRSSFRNYSTPFSLSREIITAHQPVSLPLTQRVVLVVIDGLENNRTVEMPFLHALQQEGAYLQLTSQPPFETKPNYALLSSGSWPEINGVITTDFGGPLPVDNIFRRIAEAGFSTSAAAHQWWRQLNGNYFTLDSFFYPTNDRPDRALDRKIYRQSLDFIQKAEAQFILVHFSAVAGKNVKELDQLIAGLAQELDWSLDTLIITANQQGDMAPCIAIGKGITPGHHQPANQVDLTTTITALLGISPPTEAQGRILWEIISAPAPIRAALEIARGQVLGEFMAAYVSQLGYAQLTRETLSESALLLDEARRFSKAAVYESAWQKAQAATINLLTLAEKVQTDKIWRGRWLRLPLVLVILAILIFVIHRLDRRQKGVLFISALLYALAYFFFSSLLFNKPLSFPDLASANYSALIKPIAIPAYLSLILVFSGLWLLRLHSHLLLGFCGTYIWLLLLILTGFLCNGIQVTWYLPDPYLSATTLAALYQITLLAPGILFTIVIPWQRKYPPHKEEAGLDQNQV